MSNDMFFKIGDILTSVAGFFIIMGLIFLFFYFAISKLTDKSNAHKKAVDNNNFIVYVIVLIQFIVVLIIFK